MNVTDPRLHGRTRAALVLGASAALAALLLSTIPPHGLGPQAVHAQAPPPAPRVNLQLKNVTFTEALDAVFQGTGLTYQVAPSVLAATAGRHTDFGIHADFDLALRAVLRTANRPLRYDVRDGVMDIKSMALGPDGLPADAVTVESDGGPARQALESMVGGTTLRLMADSSADYPVTLHLRDVPFDQALQAVVAQSPQPLKYKMDRSSLLVASAEPKTPVPVNNPVTLHLTDVPASEALTALLRAGRVGGYSLDAPHLQGRVTLTLDRVPFETALQTLLRQSDPHATYEWTTSLDYFGNTDLHIYDAPATQVLH